MYHSKPGRIIALLLLISGFQAGLFAQELYHPLNFRNSVKKGARTVYGKPGPDYWQNSSDYTIDVKFNPETRIVSAKAVITYENNSEDTLRKIVLRNYPDFYRKDAMRDYYASDADEGDGLILDSVYVNGQLFSEKKIDRDLTLMKVFTNLAPNSSVTLKIVWHYTLNAGSHVRMGKIDESSFFLAYFFPRIAVYDDMEHWDESQYAGKLEPYQDFDNFKVSVTVPRNFVVWCTGELQNAKDVFQDEVLKKFNEAHQSDEFIEIISSDDLKSNRVTANNEWNTYIYNAKNVTDVAFAVSDHYKWKAGSLYSRRNDRRIFLGAAFHESHTDFEEVPYFTRETMRYMADSFPGVDYPYPTMTVVDGLDQMEFPMIINDNPLEDRAEAIELTIHEVLHTLLPFYTGCNQTRYAWMDEGWSTFSEWIISPMIDSTIYNSFGFPRMLRMSGQEWDVPLIVPSTEWNKSYSANAYSKPAFCFYYLREILGKEVFNKCWQTFIQNWKGKHPTPWDFFYSFNTASGKNLNWYWKAWFYDSGEMDLKIVSAVAVRNEVTVVAEIKGKPVPLYISVFKEGKIIESLVKSPELWQSGNRISFKLKSEGDSLKISNSRVPDVNESDNVIRILRK